MFRFRFGVKAVAVAGNAREFSSIPPPPLPSIDYWLLLLTCCGAAVAEP
jgi:hypothetical protein